MAKISTKDWRNLPLEKWNVTTFHAYLSDMNKEKYGVSYVPFGHGPTSKRWATEKGQLKTELSKNGPAVMKRYIDLCFESHSFNPKYPCLSFGFMYAYKRTELARAERDEKKTKKREETAERNREEIEDEWF